MSFTKLRIRYYRWKYRKQPNIWMVVRSKRIAPNTYKHITYDLARGVIL